MQAFDNFLSVLKWQRHFRNWRTWFWKNLWTHFLALNAFLFLCWKRSPSIRVFEKTGRIKRGLLLCTRSPYILLFFVLVFWVPSSQALGGWGEKGKFWKFEKSFSRGCQSTFFFFFLSFVESSSSPGWLLSFFNICNFPMLRAAASASAKFGLSLRPLS